MPSIWSELAVELEKGAESLVFHIDMITKSIHSTTIEFIDAINTTIKFIPNTKTLKIAVLITPSTPLSVVRTLQKSGIQGIVLDLNYYSVEEVATSVNALVNKIPFWPKHIIDSLPGNIKKKHSSEDMSLTTRQEEVFKLVTERGSSNKAIAKLLGISESTVKLHLSKIFKKYGVRSRTQLAIFS
jgi:DNA-binding NarL/FixJ family response regulator